MVNMPYRSSESLASAYVENHLRPMRRLAGAIALALIAILLIGVLLRHMPEGFGGKALHDLVPLDDPLAAATFTA